MNIYNFKINGNFISDNYKNKFNNIALSNSILTIETDKTQDEVIAIIKEKNKDLIIEMLKVFTYNIEGLTCANCATKIKNKLVEKYGEADVNLIEGKLSVTNTDDEINNIQNIVDSIEDGVTINKIEETKQIFTYELEGLTCANCASKIQDKLIETYGEADVSLLEGKVTISNNFDDMQRVQNIIDSIEDGVTIYKSKTKKVKEKRKWLTPDYVILASTFIISILTTLTLKGTVYEAPIFIITYILLSYELHTIAIKELFFKRILGEHTLMAVASLGAMLLGTFTEGIAVVWLWRLGEIIENYALSKAKNELTEFDKMVEPISKIKLDDGSIINKSTNDVQVDELVVVGLGQTIAFDGIVYSGSATLDESSLTGESRIIYKNIGDNILAGSIISSGQLVVKVKNKACDSTLSKLITRLKESQGKENNTSKIITKFAKYYTPIVVLSSVLYIAISCLIDPSNYSNYVYNGLIFLVISCPCSLVISIPLAYFSALSNCARKGILFKNSQDLDTLHTVKKICFDKTGTLTYGSAKVNKIIFAPNNQYSEDYILSLVKSSEESSNHPVANAIKDFKTKQTFIVEKAEEKPALGMLSTVDGHIVKIGNSKYVSGINKGDVHVEIDGQYVATFFINDTIKEDTYEAIKELNDYDLSIVSGDAQDRCEVVAKELGIKNVYGNCTPFEKEKIISKEDCIFIGDGLNDAISMQKAKLGIAMGNIGNDITVGEADMVIGDDSLTSFTKAIQISRKTNRIAKFNIAFILSVKASVLLLAAFGLTPMFLAIASDVGLSIVSSLNSFRLLRD